MLVFGAIGTFRVVDEDLCSSAPTLLPESTVSVAGGRAIYIMRFL